MNTNRKDVHALIISINGKDMNEEYGCIAQFEKNENHNYILHKKTSSSLNFLLGPIVMVNKLKIHQFYKKVE